MSKSPEELLHYVTELPFHANENPYYAYVSTDVNPPLARAEITLELAIGDERKDLRSATTGDATLILRYKKKEGVVFSFQSDSDFHILQLQGVKPKGYRLLSAMRVVAFYAWQTMEITSHKESPFERVTLPPLSLIQGMASASEEAYLRYNTLIAALELRRSDEENIYVRDIR